MKYQLYINAFCLYISLKFTYCAASKFRLLKNSVSNVNDVTRYDFKCVKVKLNHFFSSYIECATMCSYPTSSRWEQLHTEIQQDGLLMVSELQCYVFTYSENSVCTLGLTNAGLSLPELHVEDGIVVGVSRFGGMMFRNIVISKSYI